MLGRVSPTTISAIFFVSLARNKFIKWERLLVFVSFALCRTANWGPSRWKPHWRMAIHFDAFQVRLMLTGGSFEPIENLPRNTREACIVIKAIVVNGLRNSRQCRISRLNCECQKSPIRWMESSSSVEIFDDKYGEIAWAAASAHSQRLNGTSFSPGGRHATRHHSKCTRRLIAD